MSTFLEKLKKGMKTDGVSVPADEPMDEEIDEPKKEEAEEKTEEEVVEEPEVKEEVVAEKPKAKKPRAKRQPKANPSTSLRASKPIPEIKRVEEEKEEEKPEETTQESDEAKPASAESSGVAREEILAIKNEGILATKVFAGEEKKKGKDWFEMEGQLTVDVFQNDTELVVHSAIAGVKPEDIDVTIENGVISIKGMRPKPKESQEPDYFYQECYWGKFSREIVIPLEADPAKAQATLKDGILCVRIPKAEKQQS